MSEQTTEPRSFLDRQRDAALAEIVAQQAEFRRVADIVLPPRPGAIRSTSKRVTDMVKLGDDHVVAVTERKSGKDEVMWTFVIGDKATNWQHHTQEEAILHLIAARHDGNPNSNHAAAFYAGRVLGVPAN